MTPEMRKVAAQSMVALIYNRFRELVKEFESIRDTVRKLQENPESRNSFVARTAGEIVAELESRDHSGKLQILTATLEDLKQNITDADPNTDFSVFLPTVKRVQEEAREHFESFIPQMLAKLYAARRTQLEMN